MIRFLLRYIFDQRFRDEWTLESLMESEGEDSPAVRRILAP